MKRKNITLFITTFILSAFYATPGLAQERGIDDKINEAFTPIADWWGKVVLHNFPGTEIPTIIFLLVGGALFFTFYFGFINIRGFSTAINTVRGKYDSLDHADAADENVATDGNIKNNKEDDGKEGEVSHFQALATAVSGTVGNGNIAGVALAIAVGGPGATFWMIFR